MAIVLAATRMIAKITAEQMLRDEKLHVPEHGHESQDEGPFGFCLRRNWSILKQRVHLLGNRRHLLRRTCAYGVRSCEAGIVQPLVEVLPVKEQRASQVRASFVNSANRQLRIKLEERSFQVNLVANLPAKSFGQAVPTMQPVRSFRNACFCSSGTIMSAFTWKNCSVSAANCPKKFEGSL